MKYKGHNLEIEQQGYEYVMYDDGHYLCDSESKSHAIAKAKAMIDNEENFGGVF